MRLRQIRCRTTKHFILSLEETATLAELEQLGGFGYRLTRLISGLDPCLTYPPIKSSDMDAEVVRDLRESDLWIAVLCYVNSVVAELLVDGLGILAPAHVNLLG